VEFRDHNRTTRRLPGFRHRKSTEAIGERVEKLVASKLAGEAPDVEITRWLETIPNRMRELLAQWELIDSKRVAASKLLTSHMDDFKAALVARGNTEKHASLTVCRVKRIFDGCGFRFWSNVSASEVERCLAELRKDKTRDGKVVKRGISAASSNHHLTAVKAFCKWMVRDRRASQSPVEHLKALNVRTDRRHDRRALSVEEIRWLTSVTAQGPVREGMPGADRSLLYQLAIESGLRANELRSLTRECFQLEGKEPSVTIRAAYAKNRRMDTLPLRPRLAGLMRDHLARKPLDLPAFNMPRPNRVVFMLRADLEAAREAWIADARTPDERAKRSETTFLQYRDDAGRVLDFHSLRHTTGSLLASSGVHPKTAQSLMRHSTIALTMDRYTHTLRGADRQAVNALPSFATVKRSALRATGTDDQVYDASNPDSDLALCLARRGSNPCNGVHHDAVLALSKTQKAKAEVGFEPTNNGFAIRPLGPLGYSAVSREDTPNHGAMQ
jgi:integrase